jgi:hypothetical protein
MKDVFDLLILVIYSFTTAFNHHTTQQYLWAICGGGGNDGPNCSTSEFFLFCTVIHNYIHRNSKLKALDVGKEGLVRLGGKDSEPVSDGLGVNGWSKI